MSTELADIFRIFLDHWYFSACCVFVGFLLIYGIARWIGWGFDLDDNIAKCVIIGVAASLILATYFRYKSMLARPSESIAYTKRRPLD